jgi:hypothetical protein
MVIALHTTILSELNKRPFSNRLPKETATKRDGGQKQHHEETPTNRYGWSYCQEMPKASKENPKIGKSMVETDVFL